MTEDSKIVEIECKDEDVKKLCCTENNKALVARIEDKKPDVIDIDGCLKPIQQPTNVDEGTQRCSPLKDNKTVGQESLPGKSDTTEDKSDCQDKAAVNSGSNRKRKNEALQTDMVSNLVSRSNKNDRLAKTVKLFQETGLLKCTIETAKLLRETEKMQESLDELEREVAQACKKTRLEIDEHVSKLKKISTAMDELTSKPCLQKK